MERRIPVRQLNQQTSAILKEVVDGAAVTITTGGRAVARLVPLPGNSNGLDRLVSTGRARAPNLTAPVRMPDEYRSGVADVASALVKDRDANRW